MITVFMLKYSYDGLPFKSHDSHQEQLLSDPALALCFRKMQPIIFSLTLREIRHPFPDIVNEAVCIPSHYRAGHQNTHLQRWEGTGWEDHLLLCMHTACNNDHGGSAVASTVTFYVLLLLQMMFAPVSAPKVCPTHFYEPEHNIV